MSEFISAASMIGLAVGLLVAVHRFCKRYVGLTLLQVIGFAAFVDWLSGD